MNIPFPCPPDTLYVVHTYIYFTSHNIILYPYNQCKIFRDNHTPLNTWSEVDECCKKPHLWERLSCPITHVHTWRMIQPPFPPQQSNWLQARQGCGDERLGARDLLLRCAYWWLTLIMAGSPHEARPHTLGIPPNPVKPAQIVRVTILAPIRSWGWDSTMHKTAIKLKGCECRVGPFFVNPWTHETVPERMERWKWFGEFQI